MNRRKAVWMLYFCLPSLNSNELEESKASMLSCTWMCLYISHIKLKYISFDMYSDKDQRINLFFYKAICSSSSSTLSYRHKLPQQLSLPLNGLVGILIYTEKKHDVLTEWIICVHNLFQDLTAVRLFLSSHLYKVLVWAC